MVRRFIAVKALGLSAVLLAACSREAPSSLAGRGLYDANGCASCHGPAGRGDGPLASTLPAKPTDLWNASLFKHGATESAIAKTIAQGVATIHNAPDSKAIHHQSLMPSFNHLTDTERRSIALYVISMRTDPNRGRNQP